MPIGELLSQQQWQLVNLLVELLVEAKRVAQVWVSLQLVAAALHDFQWIEGEDAEGRHRRRE